MSQDLPISTSIVRVLSLEEQRQLLDEAKELIVSGDREEALKIVVRVLQSNKNNAEAIWMYINLTPNRSNIEPALKKLLVIQPQHLKAQTMLRKLESNYNLTLGQELGTPHQNIESFSRPVSVQPAVDNQAIMQQLIMQQQRLLEHQMRQVNNPQPIHITNVNNNSANAVAFTPYPVGPRRNEQAYSVGRFFANFLGTFGVAHLMNGKPVMGIITMLLGWGWLPVFWGGISTGIGAFVVIPLHYYFAKSNAESGARYD